MKRQPATQLRPDGKASFDAIYDDPLPSAYFSALRPLEYSTPGRAQPMVRRCVEALRRLRRLETVTVLDLCAGYGVNGALLKHRLTLDDLYERYGQAPRCGAGFQRILADALWFLRRRRREARVRVVAQDVAGHALAYGEAVGLADAVIEADLETVCPDPAQAALMREADLVVVTGGLSYIGERTLSRVLRAARHRPWALYFPLRHSDTAAVDETFARAGYAVETGRRTIPHRRFKSAEERGAIRARILAGQAPDARPPSPTHLEALVKLARPLAERHKPPFADIAA